jgi:hypothetical protein
VAAGVGHGAGPLPRGRSRVQVDCFRRPGRAPAPDVEDPSRQVHHRGAEVPNAELPRPHRAPRAAPRGREVSRDRLLAGVEDPAIGRDEGPGVVGQVAPRPGERPPRLAGPDLRDGNLIPGLVPAGDDEHLPVGQGGVRGIPAAVLHRRKPRPCLAAGGEGGGVGQAVVVADVATRDEEPAVRQEAVAGAERPERARNGRGSPGCGIPHMGIAGLAPAKHPAVAHEVQVKPDIGPVERRAPFTGLGGARGGRDGPGDDRLAGRAAVLPDGEQRVSGVERHRRLVPHRDLHLAEGRVTGQRRYQPALAPLLGPAYLVGHRHRPRMGVDDDEAVAADVLQPDRCVVRPGRWGGTVGRGRTGRRAGVAGPAKCRRGQHEARSEHVADAHDGRLGIVAGSDVPMLQRRRGVGQTNGYSGVPAGTTT